LGFARTMIIIHEDLAKEAEIIAGLFQELYQFDSKIVNRDLTKAFVAIPDFNGFLANPQKLEEFLAEYNKKRVLVLTPRDMYASSSSQDDDWVFGYSHSSGSHALASNARLKRFDNKPSSVLEVPEEQYLKRLELLVVHEIGHDVVKASHFKPATWLNNKTGYQLPLGPHCTDNSCVMYEIVDIKAPPREEGCMILGNEKKYDAGSDDVIERLYPKWFCGKCLSSIKIDDSYK